LGWKLIYTDICRDNTGGRETSADSDGAHGLGFRIFYSTGDATMNMITSG
jgi:hypothetical protein